MEHTTFAKKTVVLAALGALSLMAATVRAADETEIKPENITVTIGDKDVASKIEGDVKWDQAWFDDVNTGDTTFGGVTVVKEENGPDMITVTEKGSFTINLPTSETDGKFVTFKDTGLKVEEGGVFSNSSYVKFDQGSLTVTDADFTNGEKGVIELTGEGAEFNLSVTTAEAAGNFENAGLIILNADENKVGATMNIGAADSNPFDVTSEDKYTLNVGNVEIKSGTLTNYDKGYEVKKEPQEQAEGNEASEDEEAAPQTLVKFGTVTVGANGKFVNAEGARSEGSALVLEAENRVEIDGTSVWDTLKLTKVEGAQTVTDYVKIADKQEGKNGGDFRVTGALVIDEFATDTSGNASFTINGQTNNGQTNDAKVFADGIDISAGSHVAADV